MFELIEKYLWAVILLLVGLASWLVRMTITEHRTELKKLRNIAISREEVISKTVATDEALKSIRNDLRALAESLANNNLSLVRAVHELHIQLKDSQSENNREIYRHIDTKIDKLRQDIDGMRTRSREDL